MSDCSEIGHCFVLGLDKNGTPLFGCNRGCGDYVPLDCLIKDPHLVSEIKETLQENERLKTGIRELNTARLAALTKISQAYELGNNLTTAEIRELVQALTLKGWSNEPQQ